MVLIKLQSMSKKHEWFKNQLVLPWYYYLLSATVVVGILFFAINWIAEGKPTNWRQAILSALLTGLIFGILMRIFHWVGYQLTKKI